MAESSSNSTLNLETLAERLESIESLLFALHSNSPYLEDEPFEGPESEEETAIESASLRNFIDGLGLKYFTGSEVTSYFRRKCGNTRNSEPPSNLWNNLARTLKVLDKLRSDLGVPIRITSSYRNKPYNQSPCVGGVANSHHCFARAIDFVAYGGKPAQWGAKLKGYWGKTFNIPGIGNYVFHGGIGIYTGKNFVHLDTRGWDTIWYG